MFRLDWSLYPSATNNYVIGRKYVADPLEKTFDGSVSVIATVQDPDSNVQQSEPNNARFYEYLVFERIFSEDLLFYHTDHLATPLAMTDSSGTMVWKAEIRQFGNLYSAPSGSVTNNVRFFFAGRYDNAETGLYQNWHRDYSSGLGRYVEPDPDRVRCRSQLVRLFIE